MNSLKDSQSYKDKYFVNYNNLYSFAQNIIFNNKPLKFSTNIRKDNALIGHYNSLKKTVTEFPYKLNMVFGLPTMDYYQVVKTEDDLKGRLLILKHLSDVESSINSNHDESYPELSLEGLNDDELLGVHKTLLMILGVEEITSKNNQVFNLKKIKNGE